MTATHSTSGQSLPATPSPPWPGSAAIQRCIDPACGREYPVTDVLVACKACGSLLDVVYDWPKVWPASRSRDWNEFTRRSLTMGDRASAGETRQRGSKDGPGATEAALDFSGVWRFRDLLPFYDDPARIVTIGEGRTNLQRSDELAKAIGMDVVGGGRLYLQYEGFNPSGSFKDNGMAAGFTHAVQVGASRVACASTGNTSASLGVYGSLTGMQVFVFIGDGKIAFGKLSQALEYGAITLQVAGDFDACLARVRHIAENIPRAGVYLMNSVNPFRLEGQKTIMFRVLEGLDWHVPDWIIVPGGNLGNCSAFGKAFIELRELGLITKIPRLAVIQAKGARTLDRVVNELGVSWTPAQGAGGQSPGLKGSFPGMRVHDEYARMDAAGERAHTIATAIEINRPVNLSKALRALAAMNGVVRSVDDHDIMEHKALVGRYGFGCEPASAASLAGARMLRNEGILKPNETVACILTGHVLKDPDATVLYHTGIDTKAMHSHAPTHDTATPPGKLANRPIHVPDDLNAILKAMGVAPEASSTGSGHV